MNGVSRSGIGALALSLVIGSSRTGAHHQPVISEVLGGCGDSPAAQFVEIGFPQGLNQWAGCAQLEFRGADGALVGVLEFTTNPADPLPVNSALVATDELASLQGAPRPDFTMPPLVATPAGEICLRDTGRTGCPPVAACLAYGGTSDRPDRAPALLPDGAASIHRIPPDVLDTHADGILALFPPSPQNTAGQAAGLLCRGAAMVERGARIFFEETFEGNGRTCGTCHPAAHAFTIDPFLVATLPPDDPLFVADNEPALRELEHMALLRGTRTLVLENVDGFARPPVFRGTPHLLNVGGTAPYGLAGDVPDLQTFAAMAVRQHFPRTLARIPGVDFREPREDELAAVEAFMRSIFAGDPGGLAVWSLVLGPAAARGRALFFGSARCGFCHNGPFLARPYLPPFTPFTIDTGVTRQRINLLPAPGCGDCPPIGPLEGGRGFDVPSLVGVRDTAPFFHDNSAATLRQAVAFYGSPSFNESPAAQLVGPIALWPDEIDDLTAFLEELTACGNGVVDRGESCDDGNVRDGDCCSATCATVAANGAACDDGNPCTSATECRSGVCVALDGGPCGIDGCAEPGALVAAVVTCAVASLGERASGCLADGGHIERGLGRGMRLVESALRDGASPRDRRALKRAAAAFRGAARRAVDKGVACEADVVPALRETQVRALCVRRCVAGRRMR